jgi:hypothetical protein
VTNERRLRVELPDGKETRILAEYVRTSAYDRLPDAVPVRTIGTDFKPATRPPVETIVHWNKW